MRSAEEVFEHNYELYDNSREGLFLPSDETSQWCAINMRYYKAWELQVLRNRRGERVYPDWKVLQLVQRGKYYHYQPNDWTPLTIGRQATPFKASEAEQQYDSNGKTM